jgi:lysozyme family protein
MSEQFDYAIGFILKHEGGYQCDPDDSGNWTGGKCGQGELKGTNFGIAAASYPHLDIKSLTLETAKNLYRADYWSSSFNNFDKRVGAKLFDIAVNCGTGTAAKILQRACGVKDDGQVGPVTIAAALAIPVNDLLTAISAKQKAYYAAICLRDPRKKKFLIGWNKRAEWMPKEVSNGTATA